MCGALPWPEPRLGSGRQTLRRGAMMEPQAGQRGTMSPRSDHANEETPSDEWPRRQLAREEWAALTFIAFCLLAVLWAAWILERRAEASSQVAY
jgi:hypothetical protein